MNRAARRAAQFTKAGREERAERTRDICEHGNWMKTDGNGDPMCPHGCGFTPQDRAAAREYQARLRAHLARRAGVADGEWS